MGISTLFTHRGQTKKVELRPMTLVSGKRGIKEMVDKVIEGKKRKWRDEGIPFDLEGVREKDVVVGLVLRSVLEVVVVALEEAGFILAERARLFVGEKERVRREAMGR